MGILRFLLALAVVATHTRSLYPVSLIPGMKAVQAFYIISGFYMALILEEKYIGIKNSYKLFITNRFLRIYPLYWLVLILSLIYYFSILALKGVDNHLFIFSTFIKQHNWSMLTVMLLISLFIFGQDILYFTKYVSLETTLLIPQAWTLSLELMFYLIAPFLIRLKTKYLVLIFSGSILLRFLLYIHGLKEDPWTHRLFPLEIALFILGIFSFKIYKRIRGKTIPLNFNIAALISILSMVFLFPVIKFTHSLFGIIIYFIVLTVGLPFIFYLSKDNKFDQWLGDFSYPIYICHVLVIDMLLNPGFIQKSDHFLGWWAVGGSFLLSLLLLYCVIYPIDKIRHRRMTSV